MLGKRLLVGAVAGAFVIGTAGAAMAVSDGNYDYNKQHCSAAAANSDYPDRTEPDCRTLNASLWTGSNGAYSQDNEVGAVGIHQAPDGDEGDPNSIPHDPAYNGPGATAQDHAAEGLHAYFGADDNLDSGEHDGSTYVANGPSDGGGIQANVTPLTAAQWLAKAMAGDSAYVLTHPLPGADAGTGACADGLCISVQTQRRVAYRAGAKNAKTRDAADYEGHEWDPPSCAGPSDTAKDCGGHTMAWWHHRNQTTYVEPGIQIYEDPDPQGSPEGPYPLPALYIGTCGFVAGGGVAPAFPASPITNDAGQLVVKTGC